MGTCARVEGLQLAIEATVRRPGGGQWCVAEGQALHHPGDAEPAPRPKAAGRWAGGTHRCLVGEPEAHLDFTPLLFIYFFTQLFNTTPP